MMPSSRRSSFDVDGLTLPPISECPSPASTPSAKSRTGLPTSSASSMNKVASGRRQVSSSRSEVASGRRQVSSSMSEVASGRRQVSSSRSQVASVSREVASGRREVTSSTGSVTFKEAAFRVWATVAAENQPREKTGTDIDAVVEGHAGEEILAAANDNVMPNAEILRQKKITSAARVLRSVAISKVKGLDLMSHAERDARDRKQVSPTIKKRRSFMKTTPWKTRLPPLPSVVGLHVFRRLYMAQIMAVKAPMSSCEVSVVSASDDSDDESDAETLIPPEVPNRVCAELSPEGQYAMLRAYQDRLLEKLSVLFPDLPVHLRVVQTPGLILPPLNNDGHKGRERLTERSVQDALNMLDSLEEDGHSHLADIRKPALRPAQNPLRDYRKWCRAWQGEFHGHLEKERARIRLP